VVDWDDLDRNLDAVKATIYERLSEEDRQAAIVLVSNTLVQMNDWLSARATIMNPIHGSPGGGQGQASAATVSTVQMTCPGGHSVTVELK
jgi:ribosomal protein L2